MVTVDKIGFDNASCRVVGVEYSSSGTSHRHECARCGTVWEHANACAGLEDEEWERIHKCPVCNRMNAQTRGIYFGDCAPTHSHYPAPACGSASGASDPCGSEDYRKFLTALLTAFMSGFPQDEQTCSS